MVREKLLQFTHAEIPFSSAVVIDRFEEPANPKDLLRIYCTILVDRESQKPIVVGRGGDMIKRIGTAAREELERFFDTRVFLDLHVRVKSRVARGRSSAPGHRGSRPRRAWRVTAAPHAVRSGWPTYDVGTATRVDAALHLPTR